MHEFLKKVGAYYEIIVFTAASATYATSIIDHIDPRREYISHILTREHCMQTRNGFHIKDLRILRDRELCDIIIVDNLVHSFGFQLRNGIPILEFINDRHDSELPNLADYLVRAYNAKDLPRL